MITIKSKLKDILAVPEAVAILQKHLPGFDPNDPLVAQGINMSFKAISNFPQAGVSREARDAIEADFQAAELEEA